jgi:hypothetical protein
MPKSISARLGNYSDQVAQASPTRRQNRTICVIDRTVLRPAATIASRVLRLALLALFEPVAVAVHFQDVDVVGSAGRAARRSASRIRTRRSTRRTAVLGTTIAPYCFFWQASQEAEDERVDPAAHTLLAAPEEAPVVRAVLVGGHQRRGGGAADGDHHADCNAPRCDGAFRIAAGAMGNGVAVTVTMAAVVGIVFTTW